MAGTSESRDLRDPSTMDLRDRLALAFSLQFHGPAADGLGWWRNADEEAECYARADVALAEMQPDLAERDRLATELAVLIRAHTRRFRHHNLDREGCRDCAVFKRLSRRPSIIAATEQLRDVFGAET